MRWTRLWVSSGVLFSLVCSPGSGQTLCDDASSRLAPLRGEEKPSSQVVREVAKAVLPCLGTVEGLDAAREMIETLEPDLLLYAVWELRGRIPGEELESWLRGRLEGSVKEWRVWQAIAECHRGTEAADEARLVLVLEEWARSDPGSMQSGDVRELADLWNRDGRFDDAVALVEPMFQKWPAGTGPLLGPLVEAALGQGDSERARAAVESFFAAEIHDPGPGHLAQALVAHDLGQWSEAKSHYQAYLENAKSHRKEDARRFWSAVAARGPDRVLPDLVAEFVDRYAVKNSLPGGGKGKVVAEELERFGLEEDAFRAWDEQVEKAENPVLRSLADEKLIEEAMARGRWDDAEPAVRRKLERIPLDRVAWGQLGEVARGRGDLEALIRVAEDGERAFGVPVPAVEAHVAEMLMERGDMRRAAARLVRVYRAAAVDRRIQSLRTKALTAIAPNPVALQVAQIEIPPSELQGRTLAEVVEEAEAWHSGTAGRVDAARAKALFEYAAENGSVHARARIGIMTHLGLAGWERDPKAAESMVRPLLGELETLVRAGDPYAAFVLGTIAQIGIARPVDSEEAVRLFKQGAAGGVSYASYNLGVVYGKGIGVPVDLSQARNWFLRAAEAGNAGGMFNAAMVDWDSPDDRQRSEAERWLRAAAERGHAQAVARLGWELSAGRWQGSDPSESMAWLQGAANQGNPIGLLGLGRAHLFGDGVPRDVDRARELLSAAVAAGDGHAVIYLEWLDELPGDLWAEARDPVDLLHRAITRGEERGIQGLLYWYGWGLDDRERIRDTFESLREPATAGHVTSMAGLGASLVAGVFEEKDYVQGIRWLEDAAKEGSGIALRMLGSMARSGEGGRTKNPARGLDLWLRGAEAGDPFATAWAGRALLYGEDAPRDVGKGLEMLERAKSWYDLAHYFETGVSGRPSDLDKARHYYRLLAERGNAEARGWLEVDRWGE